MSVLQVHQFQVLGCCCHPDMQVLVLVTAAIVNTLSPICVCIYSCNNDVELYMKTPPLRIPFGN